VLIGPWPRNPEFWFHYNSDDSTELMRKYGSTAHFGGSYENDKFCRLIAKIAHGLAVGYLPKEVWKTFQPLLPDLIRFGSENYHTLVGGDFTVPPSSPLMHEFDVSNAVRGDTEYIFTRIRLFACLGTPRYHAVVASRPLGAVTLTKDPARFPAS
jgi:hypothetical protein